MKKTKKIWGLILACAVMSTMLAACGGDDSSSSAPPADSVPPMNSVSLPASESQPESLPEPPVESEPPSSMVEVSSSEPAPVAQPAPEFVEGTPSVSLSGQKATVTFKLNVDSTVNTIVSTNGTSIGTGTFYDYFNRGKALEGAVGKQQLFNIGSGGGSYTYELPDLDKPYYLLVNAAENATGTWQAGVRVITLFDPANVPSIYTAGITRQNDEGENLVFHVETSVPCAVYAMIVTQQAYEPTVAQVRAGGGDYTATMFGTGSASTNNDKAPYVTKVLVPRAAVTAGDYTAYFVAEPAQATGETLNVMGKLRFTQYS